MAVTAISLPSQQISKTRWSPELVWGTVLVIPYVMVFLVLVVWPVAYGVWLDHRPRATPRCSRTRFT